MIATLDDSLQIDYFDEGSGPILVLLHAFPQTNAMWRALSEKWQRDFRVIAPNARGFGETTYTEYWSVEDSADDVARLLAHLKIDAPIALCGLSMGGYVSLAFARRHAEKLGALILADTRAEADDEAGKHKRDETIEFARQHDAEAVFDQMTPRLFSQHTLSVRPDMVQTSRDIAATLPHETVIAALKALRDRPDAVNELSQIAVPTLILRGGADELSPPASAQTFLDEIRTRVCKLWKVLAIILTSNALATLKSPCAISCVALCKFAKNFLQVLATHWQVLAGHFCRLATLKLMSSPANPFSLFPLRALQLKKERGERIAMISLYDAPTATLCCDTGVDIILVGDSLGNVILGYDSTLQVTLDDMIRHTSAVARGVAKSSRDNVQIVADLPFATYHGALQTTIDNAAALMRSGAGAVKLEGASPDILRTIETMVAMGAPVVGHIGFTPQSSLTFARVVQGRDENSADALKQQARDLQNAGCAMLVLEAVAREVAQEITNELQIPTIGIGAGSECDGQVLVWHDLIGLSPQTPRFVRRFANAHETLQNAARDYIQSVQKGEFPTDEHGWNQSDK